jgi:hypothetical protein
MERVSLSIVLEIKFLKVGNKNVKDKEYKHVISWRESVVESMGTEAKHL